MAEGKEETSVGGVAVPTRNLRAIAAMVASTIAFTLGDATMKLVGHATPTGQSVFLRCVVAVLLVAAAATYTGAIRTVRRAFVPDMGWRSLGDAGNAMCFQAALARMPFADIMGVLQLTPLSLTAASAMFLGARVGWRRWCAVAAGLAGALLVIKPGSSAFNAWALVALLSVLFGTPRDITTRRLDGGISPLVILMLSQSVVALAALTALGFETWVPLTLLQCGQIIIAAACTLIGHLWVITALRTGEIAVVAPFRYAGIVWAILMGLMLFGDFPDALTIMGIAILISAGVYTFNRERKLMLRP